MTRLESKQDELIAHYKIKPTARGMSPTKEWNDWNDKKYQLLDEIAALKQQGEMYCENCKYYKISFHKKPCADCSKESLWEAKSCEHKDTTVRYGIKQCADCGKPIDIIKQGEPVSADFAKIKFDIAKVLKQL